ncbi:glycosyl hydrolase [Paenibacillus wenxiniae]|uniref:Glycosyl hydrolase n=1 Tax=Paenibacillus wenxiniae TaxID=1636843 RepID=A0ABW4RFR8_9BACL
MEQQVEKSPSYKQPYAWAEALHTYENKLEQCEPLASSWNVQRRLQLLRGIVQHYRAYQQLDGSIHDPYSQQERYYSTPAYALAAAVLVSKGQTELLESAASALTCSIQALVEERAPDGHPDFFPIMIMGAYRILKSLLPEQALHWQQRLKEIEPEQTYVFTMSKMNDPNRMINWNAIMLSGEYMRYAEGLDGEDASWIDTYLQRYHVPRFTALGLYQDGPLHKPNCPFAYDIVTRYHLTLMMQAGYRGKAADCVDELLQRGARSSLLMLSPLGEWPTRGRSSQHQWNEATAALIFTVQAVREAQQGQIRRAGAFRHGADLAWEAIERWQTEAGDLHIVRNYYSPPQRHGYEIYTNHTCYNLWTAAALAYAIVHGEQLEPIVAYPIPASCTSYTLDTDGWFQTVFSGVPGQQLVWHTALNDPYNIPGLSRIHRADMPALIGPSSAGYRDQGFTRFAEGEIFPLIHAPAWQTTDGIWHQLADGIRTSVPFDCDAGVDPADGGGSYRIVEAKHEEQRTRLVLEWSGPLSAGVGQIQATYEQRPGIIRVSYRITNADQADIERLGAWIPLFMYDGKEAAVLEMVEDEMLENKALSRTNGTVTERLRLQYNNGLLSLRCLTPNCKVTFPPEASHVASRNGILKGVRLEGEAGHDSIAYELRLEKSRSSV